MMPGVPVLCSTTGVLPGMGRVLALQLSQARGVWLLWEAPELRAAG